MPHELYQQLETSQQANQKLMRLVFQTAQAQRAAEAEACALRRLLADVLPLVRPGTEDEYAVWQDAQARLARIEAHDDQA